jgi:hypothetical protein
VSTVQRPAAARYLVWAAMVANVAIVATHITWTWAAPDEGLLGQTAERLLRGEVPHRDFDDLYTGGLTLLHAAAFQVFGIRMIALRVVLFVAFLCWLPMLYAAMRRFASPTSAAAVTVLAVAWSIPTYPASMPSWYNLFFATAGLVALLRYAETQRLRWLVLAGMAGGFSICAKIVGLYFLGAAGLFVMYDALDQSSAPIRSPTQVARTAALPVLVAVVLSVALVRLVHLGAVAGTYAQFVVPGVASAAALAAASVHADRIDWRRLGRSVGALAAGTVIAMAPLIVFFAAHHALGPLLVGAVIAPAKRLTFAVRAPHIWALPAIIPLIGFAVLSVRVHGIRAQQRIAGVIAAAGLLVVALRHRTTGFGGIAGTNNGGGVVYRLFMDSALALAPLVPVFLACVLISRFGSRSSPVLRRQAFAAMAVTALCGVIGFPFFNDLYFFYVAPLVLVAVLALAAVVAKPVSPYITGALILVYAVFALVHVDGLPGSALPLARNGGVRVPSIDSAGATAFVDTLRAHARNGYTFATPDCPEAYFLTGLRNPTPTMYEFFDDTTGSTARILTALRERRITAVAISHWFIFSRPNPDLVKALRTLYPDSAVVWHFTVRWKSPPVAPSF